MSRAEINEPRKYYTIVSGKFHIQVEKDHPKAIRRDWTSADGKNSGTKYELIYNTLIGYVEDISFADGDYGVQLYIKLDADEEGINPIVALNAASREAESFLKRLPAIDLSKEVRLRPFSFEDEGEEIRGMEVMQPDKNGDFKVKITNFFRDPEGQANINGYPEPEGDTGDYSKDDWKIYFMQCRKFLINYAKIHIAPKLQEGTDHIPTPVPAKAAKIASNGIEYPQEDINPDDVPF
jgi:hypothetical protein